VRIVVCIYCASGQICVCRNVQYNHSGFRHLSISLEGCQEGTEPNSSDCNNIKQHKRWIVSTCVVVEWRKLFRLEPLMMTLAGDVSTPWISTEFSLNAFTISLALLCSTRRRNTCCIKQTRRDLFKTLQEAGRGQ